MRSKDMSTEASPFDTVCQYIDQGRNIFISGVGGCGKSYLLKQLYEKYNKQYPCLLSSTTGISAYNLGGVTIHSWCKIITPSVTPPDIQSWANNLVNKINRKGNLVKRYTNIKLIFLDEVSMLGSNYLDILNYVCQQVRKRDGVPFGGIQVVFGGDMMQLPPVKDDFPFESASWDTLNLQFIRLTKAWRFDNQIWVDLLHRARLGQLTKDDVTALQARVNQKEPGQFCPIVLLSKNDDVGSINSTRLNSIKSPSTIFKAADFVVIRNDDDEILQSIPKQLSPEVSKQFMMDDTVELKVGCQVMLVANLDVEGGLTNGTRGIVVDISSNSVTVQFEHGVKCIGSYTFNLEYQDVSYIRCIVPFKLAFATSIHKSQSLTLSSVEIDIGSNIFSEGQSYVALSRCRSLDGLYIKSIDVSKIKPHPKALKFERYFLKRCIEV